MERGRFLEYTDDRIGIPLRSLSNEAKDCLCSCPCIMMQEGRGEEVARVVEIAGISATDAEVIATIRALPRAVELANNALWKLRTELDLGQFEFSRNHWAVKDGDLFAVLEGAGVRIDSAIRRRFVPMALPVASRASLLGVRDALAARSHADLDDLLLEVGIEALRAGRNLGGRRARADAVLQFALANPEAVTAENSLLSQFLLRLLTPTAPLTVATTARDRAVATTTAQPTGDTAALDESASRSPNRVFVVHGRNELARTQVVEFLNSIGLEGIVLHDQPNMGRHLLTKFIDEADLVTFAVVLMTDDDVGSARSGPPAPRARQNVILELGYFLAHLGQANVCALITPGLETPSDFDGIVYIRMAADQTWKVELLRELRAARMPVSERRA